MYENIHIATIKAPPDSVILPTINEDVSEDSFQQVHSFVDALYEPADILEFRILPSRQSKWTLASTVDDVIPWLIEMNGDSQSIYVGCNPRSCEGDGTKSANCTGCGRCTKCVSVCRSLCIDIENIELSEFHFKFKECDLPAPTVTLTSGAGIHCYWRLDEEIQPQQWSKYQIELIKATSQLDLDVDCKIKDPPRVMRVPGFVNHKRHKPAKLIKVTKDATYPLDEFPTPTEQPPDIFKEKSPIDNSQSAIIDEIHGSETDIIKVRECVNRLAPSFRLSEPLLQRFRLTIPFTTYDDDALARITLQRAQSMNLNIDPEIATQIAIRSRGTPRLAIRLLESCHRYARSQGDDRVTMRHFEETVLMDGIDDLGLTLDDQKIINYLMIQPTRPVRLFTLEAATGIHRRTIQEVIEPFLIRTGLIERTPQGRVITDKGIRHVEKSQQNQLVEASS